MVKNKPGYRWVQITDEVYQKARDSTEPDMRLGSPNQFEPVSIYVQWCIDSMQYVPPSLPRKIKRNPALYAKILDVLDKEN